jgi:hypothetical protein
LHFFKELYLLKDFGEFAIPGRTTQGMLDALIAASEVFFKKKNQSCL